VTAWSADAHDSDEEHVSAFREVSDTQINMRKLVGWKLLPVSDSFGHDVNIDVSGSGTFQLSFDLGQANTSRKVRGAYMYARMAHPLSGTSCIKARHVERTVTHDIFLLASRSHRGCNSARATPHVATRSNELGAAHATIACRSFAGDKGRSGLRS
jgi:hypothetical protein